MKSEVYELTHCKTVDHKARTLNRVTSALLTTGIAMELAGALGAEFPLEVVRISGQESFLLPGNANSFFYSQKPDLIRHETPPKSSRPLYGIFGRWGFRLDESLGTDCGYDRLVMDLNANGDLSDDKVYVNNSGRKAKTAHSAESTFGPIEVPADLATGIWRPTYYTTVLLYERKNRLMNNPSANLMQGALLVKPASYLSAHVKLGEVEQTIGLWDGNCNFRLGDRLKFRSLASLNPRNDDQQPVDFIFRDRDGSGQFERWQMRTETEFWCRLLYAGGRPFIFTLNQDLSSIRVHPFEGPLASLMATGGDAVREMTVLWRQAEGEWEPLVLELKNGNAHVPEGEYQLYRCQLAVTNVHGVWVMGSGFVTGPQESSHIRTGQTMAFKCGAPLELRLEAAKASTPSPWQQLMGRRLAQHLNIQAQVAGAGGELYAGFYQGKNPRRLVRIKPPIFELTNPNGEELATGILEDRLAGAYAKKWAVPPYHSHMNLTLRARIPLGALISKERPLESQPVIVQP